MPYRPKFIGFDCYGTLIDFRMGPTAERLFADRVPDSGMAAFLASFKAYRLDEVLGDFKPFRDVVEASIRCTCLRQGDRFRASARYHQSWPTI